MVRTEIKEAEAQLGEGATFRTTAEAAMRKLQHEVRYLRSQMQSEAALKEDLQTALSSAQNHIATLKTQHAKELAEAIDEAQATNAETSDRESQLRDHKISLEGEVLNLSRQLTDLKKAYAKLRDQQRVDVSQLEATKKSAARMEVALQSTREELRREKAASESSQRRHERAMAAVHTDGARHERFEEEGRNGHGRAATCAYIQGQYNAERCYGCGMSKS